MIESHLLLSFVICFPPCTLAPTKCLQKIFSIDKLLSFAHFPRSVTVSSPFPPPQFPEGNLPSLCYLVALSLNWLFFFFFGVFISLPSQKAAVGLLNPQEMALFGSMQPLLRSALPSQSQASSALHQKASYVHTVFQNKFGISESD